MEHRHDHDHGHGHGDATDDHGDEHMFDPADYVWPAQMVTALGDDCAIEVDERRPRAAPESGAGAGHTGDLVLRARRLR